MSLLLATGGVSASAFDVTVTEGFELAVASVSVAIAINTSVTEAKDTAIGSIQGVMSATSAVTEVGDTSAGSIQGVMAVTLAVTEVRDTVTGSVQGVMSVTSAVTETTDTVTSTIQGVMAVTSTVTETPELISAQFTPEAFSAVFDVVGNEISDSSTGSLTFAQSSSAPSGLRRFLIQYYTDQAEKKTKKLVDEVATVKVLNPATAKIPKPAVSLRELPEYDIDAGIRKLVRDAEKATQQTQELLGRLNVASGIAQDGVKLFGLSVDFASDYQRRISKQQQDDEDLMLLALAL